MTLIPKSPIHNVSVIDEEDKQRISYFLQGAVYCWCKNMKEDNGENKPFALQDLMGGENNCWKGTPLQRLYDERARNNASTAYEVAAKDGGNLLKAVIDSDQRRFKFGGDRINEYTWIPEDESEDDV